MKIFFKIIRAILGPFMLLWEIITRPKGISRDTQAQAEIDLQCKTWRFFSTKPALSASRYVRKCTGCRSILS